MKILIAFESIEGQTRKICEFAAQRLRALGHTVEMFDTQDKLAPLSLDGFDKIVLAAPVHERRHPQSFELFITANKAALASLQTLMISVSLNAAFPECLEEAREYLTEMKMRTGFTPDMEILAAGAVRPASYGYFESQVVRNVLLADQKIELFDGEREFTDWDALGAGLDAFLDLPAT
ncbi:MAG: protoporphyrinogen oxidase [Octadecabacter sp.]|nr:protoporphyrinogen oxidase [Octadecabacter sp.]